jgi:hypothetical protein
LIDRVLALSKPDTPFAAARALMPLAVERMPVAGAANDDCGFSTDIAAQNV